MNGAKSIGESPAMGIPAPEKRVILSMGGKGGAGIMPRAGLCRVDLQILYFGAVQRLTPLTCTA
jgi:hypothetical protein